MRPGTLRSAAACCAIFIRNSSRSSGTREELAVEASYLMRAIRMMPAEVWEALERRRHGK